MPADNRPNILILFTDQQRADSIAALGNPIIRTPHFDRLAREGTAFARAYTPSPVCVAARCSMLYGAYTQRTGLHDNGPMPPHDRFVSYPQFLAQHGYRTHAIGKCHFTPDKKEGRGFQTRQLQEECTSDPATDDYVAYLAAHGLDYDEPQGARGQMYYVPQVASNSAAHHPTAWVGDESIRFLRDSAALGKPWCLFSSFIHPHPPFAPPKPWHRLYHVRDFPVPEPLGPEDERGPFCWVNRHQNRYKYRDGGFDRQIHRLIQAYYYACISFIDFQTGRILAALEESGQMDNTLIVFSSDHGELLGDFGCYGKRSMHDAAARVPMIVRQPGRFGSGLVNETAVSLIDLFPTFAGAAGLEKEAAALGLDGRDLAELAACPDPDRVVFSQLCEAERGIYLAVNSRGKYVRSTADRASWAYDHDLTRPDRDNQWGADAPDRFKQLESAQLEMLARYGDTAGVERGPGGTPVWREYPPIDESYLADPNAKLLNQPHPAHPMPLPGYIDKPI